MITYTCAGIPLSHQSSFPLVAARPIGKGQGSILFNLVVKKADGWARRSFHGLATGSFSSSFFSLFSSFFSSLREADALDEGFSSAGWSAMI